MMVKEVSCSSALHPTGREGLDYSLNPYRGCQMGCAFCYAPALLPDPRPWGQYLEVKTNIPLVLAKEVRHREKGVVGMATATDPYVPLEATYEVTRRCLEVLLRYDWPIRLLTRSSLVVRDLDLLPRFSYGAVGSSLCLWDEGLRRILEPHAPPVTQRLEALGRVHDAGVPTWASISPILPGITEFEAKMFVPQLVKVGVDRVVVDRLRLRPGVWENLVKALREHPVLLERHRQALWSSPDYFEGVEARLGDLCRDHGLRVEEAPTLPRGVRRPSGSSSTSRSPSSGVTTLDLLQM